MPLRDQHLAEGRYAERLNSTSQPYRVENEDTHLNSSAVSVSSDWLHIPDYGVIVLERT